MRVTNRVNRLWLSSPRKDKIWLFTYGQRSKWQSGHCFSTKVRDSDLMWELKQKFDTWLEWMRMFLVCFLKLSSSYLWRRRILFKMVSVSKSFPKMLSFKSCSFRIKVISVDPEISYFMRYLRGSFASQVKSGEWSFKEEAMELLVSCSFASKEGNFSRVNGRHSIKLEFRDQTARQASQTGWEMRFSETTLDFLMLFK